MNSRPITGYTWKVCLIVSTLFAFSSLSALAQKEGSATLVGQIKDSAGSSVAGASILLKRLDKGATSDEHGRYRIEHLPAGEELLHVSYVGYTPSTHKILLKKNQTTTHDIVLSRRGEVLSEVEFTGQSKARTLQQSANAVDVITTEKARLRTGDMGQLLAQTKGVNVRRNGGLGSEARFSLNGLTDDQIRFFVDGVPAQFSAYSNGVANIPINLIERIEIFKGVVPVRFGADALGGAVNMVTSPLRRGWHGSASYQFGSFNAHRITAHLQYQDSSGFFGSVGAFYDYTDNNYKVDVQVGDSTGAIKDRTVRRFHDGYKAKAINASFGIKNQSWANELSIHAVLSDYFKEVQNNNIMTVPYGEVFYTTATKGTHLVYKKDFRKQFSIALTAGYTYNEYNFADTAHFVYDWFGKIINNRFNTGEIHKATDQIVFENNSFARLHFLYKLHTNHTLQLSLAPTYITRSGDERKQNDPSAPDPLGTKRLLSSLVNGVELESSLYDQMLQNILFVKQYLQKQESQEILPGGSLRNRNRSSQYYGAGNGLRYFITPKIIGKLSYEYATRLPNANEVFGDGRLSQANLELQPERSHNVNAEFNYDGTTSLRRLQLNVTGFLRSIQNMITQFGNDNLYNYQNVASARATGAEVAMVWSTLSNRLSIDANATYINYLNTSTSGPFAVYKSDRIPNRPYGMANASAQYRLPALIQKKADLTLFWNGGYIHEFYRGWESAGLSSSKQIIPSQFSNNIGATVQVPVGKTNNAITAEIQNLFNAKIYDNFGIQKPGIGFYFKLITQL